jgi:hypothetical protein
LEHETLPDLAAFLQKMNRYTTLAAQQSVAAGCPPRWRERWVAPALEVGRRLIWKQGLLDGPQGWAFCLLGGLSQWVLADKHRRAWLNQRTADQLVSLARPEHSTSNLQHRPSNDRPFDVGRSMFDVRCSNVRPIV